VISVAARLAGLPCWVLRVLDQEGIVVPVRTDSNRRLYSDNDIALLGRVRDLTEPPLSVNIAGVKVILEMERAHARELADAREREQALRRQWEETQAALEAALAARGGHGENGNGGGAAAHAAAASAVPRAALPPYRPLMPPDAEGDP